MYECLFSIRNDEPIQDIERLGDVERTYSLNSLHDISRLFHSFFILCICTRLCLWKTHKCPHAFVGIVNAWRCVTSGPRCEVLSRATTARRYLIWTSCKPRQWLSMSSLAAPLSSVRGLLFRELCNNNGERRSPAAKNFKDLGFSISANRSQIWNSTGKGNAEFIDKDEKRHFKFVEGFRGGKCNGHFLRDRRYFRLYVDYDTRI